MSSGIRKRQNLAKILYEEEMKCVRDGERDG